MLPESGRKVPLPKVALTNAQFCDRVGIALRTQLGGSRQATKTVMAWAGVCDRAARTWIHGGGGMSGLHLVQLARHSDPVWRLLLELSDREESALSFEVHAVEVALSKAMGAMEVLKRQMIARARRQ
jgi:hypothetical protein